VKDLKGKVAVITGAAEGIGKAIALLAAAEGMKLVLADINAGSLAQTVNEIESSGVEVLGMRVDVSKEEDVEQLANLAFERFGNVHLLVNNAGVAFAKTAWETTAQDWEWLIGVNLYGVSHALRAFIPRMLDNNEEGHIVNTASMAGLISSPALAAYGVSKFGVVAITEGLHHDLTLRKSQIGVSLLCPGWVKTRITDSERNREKKDRTDFAKLEKVSAKTNAAIFNAVQAGLEPRQVADQVFHAIKENRFYILTHAHAKAAVAIRTEDILQDRPPTFVPI
jgi:NAD(P)-dependent dehydrogenase (short-subunit alcohol dehydrogenase family)